MDILTKKQRSYCMSRVKGKNTKIETTFRHYVWAKGIKGYRVYNSKIFGKPDLYFSKKKIAVFIDGCFWHKCAKCDSVPKNNHAFWVKKLNGNRERDKTVTKKLSKNGVKVIRFWER